MSDTSEYNLSMAGCGFLGIYHIGVAAALEKYVPDFKDRKMSGASAGAMAGVYFLCGVPVEHCVHDILDICRISRSKTLGLFCPTVNVTQILRRSMERHLPQDAHLIVSGKIHISMTRCHDLKNVIISHFESRDDLIQAVLCSGFIPVFSGWRPPLFRGLRYMDGGYSDNHPIIDDNTITVSPFSGESDICPRDHINIFNMMFSNTSFQLSRINFSRVSSALFPAKPEILFNTCEQGYSDTIKFLLGNQMIQCEYCKCRGEDESNNNPSECKSINSCVQCQVQREFALKDSLPGNVTAVMNKFVDNNNISRSSSSGLLNRVYNTTSSIVDSTAFNIFNFAWSSLYL